MSLTLARTPLRTRGVAIAVTLVTALAVLVAPSTPAHAATSLTVDSTTDAPDADPSDGVCNTAAGDCTLRAAVQTANEATSGDGYDIVLAGDTYTLTEGQIQIDVATPLAITGEGTDATTIDGDDNERIFQIGDGANNDDVTIEQLTLTGGEQDSGSGGAIYQLAGHLTVDTVSFRVNATVVTGSGGAIAVLGDGATIRDSEFVGNSSATTGGAMSVHAPVTISGSTFTGNTGGSSGAVYVNNADIDVTNSTISGNSPGGGSGALAIQTSDGSGATASLDSVTITDNDFNNGISVAGSTATVELTNTILDDGCDTLVEATIVSLGHNLASDASFDTECTLDHADDADAADLLLGALADNGGPTQTHALQVGSPAIDAGATSLGVDQRGVARDANSDIGAFGSPASSAGGGAGAKAVSGATQRAVARDATPDIGAFESSASSAGGSAGTIALTVDTTADDPASDDCDGDDAAVDCSLRAAVEIADQDVSGDDYRIDVPAGTYVLGQSLLIDGGGRGGGGGGELRIVGTGSGDGGTEVTALEDVRMIDLRTQRHLIVEDAAFTGARLGIGGGGVLYANAGPMTIRNARFEDNQAYGGAAIAFRAPVTVEDSVFIDNSGDVSGGGAIRGDAGSDLTVRRSTFAGNHVTGSDATRGNGGAIYHDRGTLTLSGNTFTDNTASGKGGAVWSSAADVQISGSVFSANHADASGGALHFDGLAASSAATIANTTISGNTATSGGGIYLATRSTDSGSPDTLTLDSVTITGNDATGEGDGVYVDAADATTAFHGQAQLTNTIVYDNDAASDDCVGAGNAWFESLGNNLDSDDTCGLDSTSDKPATDPLLAALSDNDGPTRTHALVDGSPAIDAGATDLDVDQRGQPRPFGDADDIGAFELQREPSTGGGGGTPANEDPVAVDDAVTASAEAVTIDVLANDNDANGDELTIESVTEPGDGTADIYGDVVVYTPDDEFVGTDAFEYTVSDGGGGSDTATVTVAVEPADDPTEPEKPTEPEEPTERLLVVCDDPVDAFGDDDGSTHEGSIDCLSALGLLLGYADGTVGAGDDITRGQVAGTLMRLVETVRGETAGQVCPDGGEPLDDTPGTTFALEIACLNSLGVVNGYTDGDYRPGQTVTRAQAASLLDRAATYLGQPVPAGDPAGFIDVAAGATHADAVASLAAVGVFEGYGDSTFGPADPITRGELASAIGRLLVWLDEQQPLTT